MSRPTWKHSALLLSCVLALQPAPQLAAGSAGGGVVTTALLTYPEYFCALTEQSSPYAYIGFALQIDGRVGYFKTSTTNCRNLHNPYPLRPDRAFDNPMFGERVTLYGGRIPTRLGRENGDLFDIEPSELSTTRHFFLPSVVVSVHEAPAHTGVNPHPDLILRECRLLTDVSERDLCLWYQAGFQRDEAICGELSSAKAEHCRTWIANIRTDRVNK